MLAVTRRENETIVITVPPSDKPQRIEVMVCQVGQRRARLGVTADRTISIHRGEVQERVDAEARGE